MSLNQELLELLVCPECKGPLPPCPKQDGLRCPECMGVYPVREDIPVMLVEERIPDEQWEGSRES